MSILDRQVSPKHHELFWATVEFLKGRLGRRETLEWAASLGSAREIERIAVLHVLDRDDGKNLARLHHETWRLLEESWLAPEPPGDLQYAVHHLRSRIVAGDRSGALVASIVRRITPRLELEPPDSRFAELRPQAGRRPRRVEDLLRVRVNGPPIIDAIALGLDELDGPLLLDLAAALDSVLAEAMALRRRLGIDYGSPFMVPRRVCPGNPDCPDSDPDESSTDGIVAATRLLYEVVTRLVSVDLDAAQRVVSHWRGRESLVHDRLWAALARRGEIATGEEIGEFLLGLHRDLLWSTDAASELTELRARRFADLPRQMQKNVCRELRKGPPRTPGVRDMSAEEFKRYQVRRALVELRRIEVAGGDLPTRYATWLVASRSAYPQLDEVTLESGFPEGMRAVDVVYSSDEELDRLSGAARLDRLERAMASKERWWIAGD